MHKHRSFRSRVHKTGLIVKHNLRHYNFEYDGRTSSLNRRDIMRKRAANLLGLDTTVYKHRRLCEMLHIKDWMANNK